MGSPLGGRALAWLLTLGFLLGGPRGADATPPPSPERLDALDFDNGAFLLEQSPSYGTGTNRWAAWHLSDGSDEEGWCSDKGQTSGASYLWELDTVWRLDTLALSTKNLQESQYPGISARTVELLVSEATTGAAGGAWKSLGKFEVGKAERREHALPKGTRAARVKLIVVANHGHAEYTELAEVDLFGQRAAPGAVPAIDGDYSTNFGPMRFITEGDDVYGCYDWAAGQSLIWGTISGRVARVTWWEKRESTQVREGRATFSVAGNRIAGVWYEGGTLRGEWAGPRVPRAEGPKCKPEKKQQVAENLQRQGRVVLYGIRFDTGSDVPRPDSRATLDGLLQALQAQKQVRVTIEGHTDAVADDAYNLDLSNRRARSVVAWLVKQGVPAARLEAKGYGRTRPVADNATSQGRALNRRVEAAIIK